MALFLARRIGRANQQTKKDAIGRTRLIIIETNSMEEASAYMRGKGMYEINEISRYEADCVIYQRLTGELSVSLSFHSEGSLRFASEALHV